MNPRVVLSVLIAVVAVWGGAASQLDVLFGATASKIIVAACSLSVASMAAALGVLSTQAQGSARVASNPDQLAEILKLMPGVSGLAVNAQASPKLAQLAVSSANNKIEPVEGSEDAVLQVAQKATATP
jgi:alcohol dehydrogenase class IV